MEQQSSFSRGHAQQHEKPPLWEACTLQLGRAPACCNWRKPPQQQRPSSAIKKALIEKNKRNGLNCVPPPPPDSYVEALNPQYLKYVLVALCDPIDCSPPGSTVHEILQAILTLEWVAISFSSGSFWPRDWNQVSCIEADALPSELLGKPIRLTNWSR